MPCLKSWLSLVSVVFVVFCFSDVTFARGRIGHRGVKRGIGARAVHRTPSPSRISHRLRRPVARPARPSRPVSRPARPSARPTRPVPTNRPARPSTRPAQPPRPDQGQRPTARPTGKPSKEELEQFLELQPAHGRPSTGFLGGAGAAAIPQDGGPGNQSRPGQAPGTGQRLPTHARPTNPGRVRAIRAPHWDQLRQRWQLRRKEVVAETLHHFDHWHERPWWHFHPYWAHEHWITDIWLWATWDAISRWFVWNWDQPVYYNYGKNVYYEDSTVYYDGKPVATADQYAQQARALATVDLPPSTEGQQWLSLGVFAVTQDEEGVPPTMFVQLAVNKEGLITGTFYNEPTQSTQVIVGQVDKQTQRAAWKVKDTDWPVVETGIANLTEDVVPILVHFSPGEVQRWLLVRVPNPKEKPQQESKDASASDP